MTMRTLIAMSVSQQRVAVLSLLSFLALC